MHELVLEARDQGTPSRAARVPLKVTVLDVNDNSPEIVDPQGDVVSVREEQPPGTEVARVRALDTDLGENASVTYTILKGNALQPKKHGSNRSDFVSIHEKEESSLEEISYPITKTIMHGLKDELERVVFIRSR